MSPSEIYAFNFQNSEPKYYTRIPNILDHLTYKSLDKNKKETSTRLSVYAKELYRIIRMIASDDGVCFYTTKSLAEKMNCSTGTICNAKKELLMPMQQLDGNPLLIEKRKKTSKIENGKVTSQRDLCTYTIFDIWKWNNAFMSTLYWQNKSKARNETDMISPERNTDSCGESVGGTDSCGESVSQGTDSCGEPNNNTSINNPLFKKQQTTAVPLLSASLKKERPFPSDDHKDVYAWLMKNGCSETTSYKICISYSKLDIKAASDYTNDMNRKKKLSNKWGYFQSALKNKYWLNK